jgi:hypothetical protein
MLRSAVRFQRAAAPSSRARLGQGYRRPETQHLTQQSSCWLSQPVAWHLTVRANGLFGPHKLRPSVTRWNPWRRQRADYGSEGWGFESLRARYVSRGEREIGPETGDRRSPGRRPASQRAKRATPDPAPTRANEDLRTAKTRDTHDGRPLRRRLDERSRPSPHRRGRRRNARHPPAVTVVGGCLALGRRMWLAAGVQPRHCRRYNTPEAPAE